MSRRRQTPTIERQPPRRPRQHRRNDTANHVITHRIGQGYGPYEPASTPAATAAVPFVWEKDTDYEDSDPFRDESHFTIFSARGWVNMGAVGIIITALLVLFIGWPIILHLGPSLNLGNLNATGQIPTITGFRGIVDKDTPLSAYTRTGSDGQRYDLVFSDEFSVDGRTFYPSDDPYWEAVDMHYWPTGDLEWYDPGAITTENGKLVITISEQPSHNLNFMSGMLTTWNKTCFTTGYVEVSISMPGSPTAPGLWPGAWMMGNLGRAGYGATTEGMWPYSYDNCDVGTFPNQTDRNGNPVAAATGGTGQSPLSFLPGQRLSACTCPGSDHPGPTTSTGRGVPEIDIIETRIDTSTFRGQVSQSAQIAPMNMGYNFTTSGTTIFNQSETSYNTYKGGEFQQAVSTLTYIDSQNYNGSGYAPYGVEWWSNPDQRSEGYITWFSNGQQTWSMTADSIGPDPVAQIGPRLISEEPMYLILNLGMSPSFQPQDYKHLVFPSKMYVDYVRVYQRHGLSNALTCDPPNRPTANYINNHASAYTNPNFTTWFQAGNYFPRNSVYDGC